MMKRITRTLVILSFTLFIPMAFLQAQDDTTENEMDTTEAASDTGQMDTSAMAADTAEETEADTSMQAQAEEGKESGDTEQSAHQVIKDYFIEGGGFMFPVLICLIIGLAVSIERIITLNLKTVNSRKLLEQIESYFEQGDVEGARETARNTRGPIASIFYQAIERRSEGTEIVEKSVVSYGSVQMGLLERGLTWISLFIAIAPMLGFMGTVIGMIQAFDSIEAAGDVSPSLVAAGIKTALLTTVAGLIVGVILQVFYNYIVSKVDNLVNDMEDASISLVDLMIKYGVVTQSGSKNQ